MKLLKGILIFLALTAVFSSCVQVRLRTANDNYAQFAYAPAALDYEYVLRKRQDAQAVKNIADCYRQMGNPIKTEFWYSKVVQLPDARPEYYLYLAEAMIKNGKCTEARKPLSDYIVFNRNNIRAQHMLESCDSLQNFSRDTTLFTVSALRLNIPGENFLSPTYYRTGIVFLSDHYSRGLTRTLSDGTGKRYLDLFYAKRTERGNWLDPEPLSGNVNGLFNEGPAVFSANDSVLYFTRNNYVSNTIGKNKDNVNVLKVFEARFVDGEWLIVDELKIGNGDYSIAHPAISNDGNKLYFASDMPWGYGGTDIYYCKKENGVWSQPVNMGPKINTEGNEAFPFIWKDSTIYFSSDGQKGMGGFDIYESVYRKGDWQAPLNLGVPVNSNTDDFSFIMDETGLAGYFSSSRGGLNDKIYSFVRTAPQLSAKLTLRNNNGPVIGAYVKLFSDDKVLDTRISDVNGIVNFKLDQNKNYRLDISHREYFMQVLTLSTINARYSETLSPVVNLQRIELNKSQIIDSVMFKKKDWQLKLESAKALDRLTTLLKNNPQMQIEIGSYTDTRGSDADNLDLTQRRAELVMQYLIRNGISAKRLSARGYGESRLRNKCVNGILCIEEEHEANNRIEIIVKNLLTDTGL
jgi:peptidoglycan-associated lipoprotein